MVKPDRSSQRRHARTRSWSRRDCPGAWEQKMKDKGFVVVVVVWCLVFSFFFGCCCWIEGSCDKVGSHHSWHPEMSSAPQHINTFPCFARRKSLPLHPPAGSTAPCPSPSRRRPRSNRPRTLVLKGIAAWGCLEVKVVLLDGSGDVPLPKMQFYICL